MYRITSWTTEKFSFCCFFTTLFIQLYLFYSTRRLQLFTIIPTRPVNICHTLVFCISCGDMSCISFCFRVVNICIRKALDAAYCFAMLVTHLVIREVAVMTSTFDSFLLCWLTMLTRFTRGMINQTSKPIRPLSIRTLPIGPFPKRPLSKWPLPWRSLPVRPVKITVVRTNDIYITFSR